LLSVSAQIAKESAHGPGAARFEADETILRLEGFPIIARVLRDTACFERVLKQLPDMLAAP
jgi:hypothetical protein